MQLYDINGPEDIKKLTIPQLMELAQDIRSFLIESISKTGGHLSSNLGAVELTIGMHYVFNSPKDKFLFDVGHQSYIHKILTGRANKFGTLRQKDGLSGFQKRAESPHDPWESGHSSTTLSGALGMAIARDLKHEDYEVISFIGDGSLMSGMSMEALNDIGSKQKKVIIVFNDNNMSISKNIGGIEKRITMVRSSKFYQHLKRDVKGGLSKNSVGEGILNGLVTIRDHLKHEVVDGGFFQEFNIDYLGPIDGHNLKEIITTFEKAKDSKGPIVIHAITKKGKGYSFAEKDTIGKWHGVPPFNIYSGEFHQKTPATEKSWSEVISATLMDLAKKDDKIVAITPAMANGSKLLEFQKQYPNRFFDTGIAEQHSVTMACGMALEGLHPFISVYSSFLQRAYDQMNHDLGRMNLPVVVGIDRAGLVGDDGETHQGIYDIAMLRNIPNLILSQPKDAKEAQDLLYTAFVSQKPFCIRYPRGNVRYTKKEEYNVIPIGSWTKLEIGENPKSIIISYGPDVDRIVHSAKENKKEVLVVNARFFKPLDHDMLDYLFKLNLPIHVYETDCKIGSLSSAILEYKNEKDQNLQVIGIDDHFVTHGSIRSLRIQEHIDISTLFGELEKDE
ncbi:MAG: 1-deoxy-D-xylulose-5-phosphate synthase [Firmicutes bacterium]|nr:1-deoxy-D-xylulose-5-phosphate synthase [Bacillota bacterium]